MKQRYVVLTIDTIAELLKDYISNPDDIPPDAMPVKLMLKPTEAGKLAIEFVSDHFNPQSLTPLTVKFDLKRIYSV